MVSKGAPVGPRVCGPDASLAARAPDRFLVSTAWPISSPDFPEHVTLSSKERAHKQIGVRVP